MLFLFCTYNYRSFISVYAGNSTCVLYYSSDLLLSIVWVFSRDSHCMQQWRGQKHWRTRNICWIVEICVYYSVSVSCIKFVDCKRILWRVAFTNIIYFKFEESHSGSKKNFRQKVVNVWYIFVWFCVYSPIKNTVGYVKCKVGSHRATHLIFYFYTSVSRLP